jgi:hypothetical protein
MKLKLYTDVYLTETSDMQTMKNLDDLKLSEFLALEDMLTNCITPSRTEWKRSY